MPANVRTRSSGTPTHGATVSTRAWCSSRDTSSRTAGRSTGTTPLAAAERWQLRGRAPITPGTPSRIGDYPEAFNARERYFPDGRLQNFQRHRLRMWSIYNFGLGRHGRSVGVRLVASRVGDGLQPGRDQPAADDHPARASIAAAGYPDLPAVDGLLRARAVRSSSPGTACWIPTSTTTSRCSARCGRG